MSVRQVLIILSTLHQTTPPHAFDSRICKNTIPEGFRPRHNAHDVLVNMDFRTHDLFFALLVIEYMTGEIISKVGVSLI